MEVTSLGKRDFFLREKKLRDSRIVKIFRLSCGVVSAGAAAPSTNAVSVSATLFLLLLCFSVFRRRAGAAREVASLLITRPCFEFLELSFFDRDKKNEYIVNQNNMASQTSLLIASITIEINLSSWLFFIEVCYFYFEGKAVMFSPQERSLLLLF